MAWRIYDKMPVMMPNTNASSDNALHDHAQSLLKAGEAHAAVGIYRQLVLRHPKNARLLLIAGNAEIAAGQYRQAAELLERAISLDPAQADAHCHLGVALWHLGDYPGSASAYRKAIDLMPDFAEAHNNLSLVLMADGQKAEAALYHVDQSITLKPDYADAHNNRGNILQAQHRYQEALAAYDRAIALRPDFANAYNNKGNTLLKLEHLTEAIGAYRKAIALKPDYTDAYCHMGIALRDLGLLTDAHDKFKRALAVDPSCAQAYFNLAELADKTRDRKALLANLDRAIALNPEFADAYWNKSLLMLLLGDFEQGFRLYEWGWKNKLRGTGRGFNQPLWLGQEPLAGKRLLIHQEQGIGDCIHYARYVQMAVAQGAEVIIEVVPALVTLLKRLNVPCTVVKLGDRLPAFDRYVPLMSLPLAFGTTLANMPPSAPYLSAAPERLLDWSARLGPQRHPRVGLVWSGSAAHKNDRNRSMALKDLSPLLSLPLEFHCLQREFRASDAEILQDLPMIHTHDKALNDFADTAALVALMDVVISVDTSVAHLAGAMGKAVWIMLPEAPDWRWLLERQDSPWYPSARLFRQEAEGDWPGVVQQLREALMNTLVNKDCKEPL